MNRLLAFLRLIRFEHTLFALPYAVAGAFLAARGVPSGPVFFWIIVAMVGARTAAMTFNRLVDRRFDRANERTAGRASSTGEISAVFLVVATALSAALFVVAARMLNDLAFVLSFPTLGILLFYSLTKRFSDLSHYVLGVALGISPLGAWVAVRGSLDGAAAAAWMGLAVVFWTAGFDILYACQDVEFDRRARLRSVPVRFGVAGAIRIARASHVLVPVCLFAAGIAASLGGVYDVAIALCAGLLVYEHAIVKSDDLTRLNRAFFTVNVVISMLIMVGTMVDLLVISKAAA